MGLHAAISCHSRRAALRSFTWLDIAGSGAVIHGRGRLLDFEVMVRPLKAMSLLQQKTAQMLQAM